MSIAYNQNEVFLLMVENNGIVPNLSDGMMLEVACRVGARGGEPLRIQPAGTFEKGLLEGQYAYEKLTVDGARRLLPKGATGACRQPHGGRYRLGAQDFGRIYRGQRGAFPCFEIDINQKTEGEQK